MFKKLQTLSFYSLIGGSFLIAPLDTPVHRFLNDYKVQAYEGFRPYLCKMLNPENVYTLEYYLLMSNILGKPKVEYSKTLEVELPGGRKVRNPLCLAAGYDRNGRALENLFELGFGGVEVGSVTLDQERTDLNLKYDFKHEEVRAQDFGECSGIMMVKGHLHSYYRSLEEEKEDIPIDSPKRKNLNRVLGINIVPNIESQEHTPYLIDSEFEQEAREILEYGDYVVLNLANGRNEAILQFKNDKKLASLIKKIKRARTLETGYQAAFDYEINDVLKGKVLDQTSDETKQLSIVFNHYDRNTPVVQRKTPLLFIKIDANQTSEELKKIAKVALAEGLDGIVVGSALEYKDASKDKSEKLGGSENSSYALNALKEIYKVTQGKIVLISSGGVFDEKDVLERIENGANLVQVYTSFALGGPYMVQRLVENLTKEAEEKLKVNNLQTLNQLTGIKLRQGSK